MEKENNDSKLNWHQRFKYMKKVMGYTNTDISEITGMALSTIKDQTKPTSEFNRWLKLSIVVFETFQANEGPIETESRRLNYGKVV